MFAWQNIAVGIVLLLALAYVARRGWSRLRSFKAARKFSSSSCGDSCGCSGSASKRELIHNPTESQRKIHHISN